jgi:hypothetical protein
MVVARVVTLITMRPVVAAVGCLAACGGPATYHSRTPDDDGAHAGFVADDGFKPAYGKADLDRALIADRGKEATLEQQIAALEANPGPDDQLHTAIADLAIRRRFIASLEACEAAGRDCPPRLDEPPWTWEPDAGTPPPLDTAISLDLAGWQRVSSELHGRACACRTVACLDGLGAAIDQLEARVEPAVRDDDAAAQSITWARECLLRLRGGRMRPPPIDASP